MSSLEKKLDQFYTKDNISFYCVEKTQNVLKEFYNLENVTFLEPSAGDGSFLRSIKGINAFDNNKIVAVDIMPKDKTIIKLDFLTTNKETLNLPKKEKVITIGNPPFGKRSKLSIDFFNHASKLSDTIAFIVPVQWNKWSVQSKLNKEFKLIYSENLDSDSFLFKGKSYGVRSVFQIWTKKNSKHKNLRILTPPKTKHNDFEIYQYNNTKQAEKYFYYDWDFAVPRQGFYDYSIREVNEVNMKRNMQWMFFKTNDKDVLNTLWNIDFLSLAKKNTTILGFGKADVIEEYEKILSKKEVSSDV